MVYEVILIDNANEYYTHYSEILHKIKLITPSENMFVNPSWNVGMNVASMNKVGILNDDIEFNTQIFTDITDKHLEKYGVIGMSSTNYTTTTYNPTLLSMDSVRPWGWGCMLLLDKREWIPIPNELKVWYGDDWLIKFNPMPKSILNGLPIQTEMSSTSDRNEFDNIKNNDTIQWKIITTHI